MGKQLIFTSKILLVVLLSLSACNNNSTDRDAKVSIMDTANNSASAALTKNSKDVALIEAVRNDVLSLEPVYDVVVIKGKKETLVAYKVKQLHRFRMKQIEKDINQKLKKDYPDEEFVISSDLKIFIEANELVNQAKQPNYPEKKANKQFDKIISLNNELT